MDNLNECIKEISNYLGKIEAKSNCIMCCWRSINNTTVIDSIGTIHSYESRLPLDLVERFTRIYRPCKYNKYKNCHYASSITKHILLPFLDYPTLNDYIIQDLVKIVEISKNCSLLEKLIEKELIDYLTRMHLYLVCDYYNKAKEIMRFEHPTTKTLEYLLSNEYPSDKKLHFELLHLILGYKIGISQLAMHKAIQLDNVNYISILINYGYKPTFNDLEKMFILDKFNQDTFKELLKTGITANNQIFNYLLNEYETSNYPKMTLECLIDLVNCMIDHGYKLTKEDVICAIKYKVAFPDLQKFGITVDNDILNACVKEKYYPYVIKDKPSMEILYEACGKSNNLPGIKKLITAGCQPDQKCLEIASTINPNLPVIKYFIEKYNLKPNKAALTEAAGKTNKNKTLMYMLNFIEIK